MNDYTDPLRIPALIILLLPACLLQCGSPDTPLYGSWRRLVRVETNPFILTLTFGRDGRYRAWHEEGFTWGEWDLTGDRLTIIDYDCSEYVGTYDIGMRGNSLTFTLVADDSNRPEVLPGTWTRVPGPPRTPKR